MHTKVILTNLLKENKQKIHGAHISFLTVAIDAVLSGARLTCTHLGRSLSTQTSAKHNIKRVNYMLGNSNLNLSRHHISEALIQFFLANREHPLIIVDWSSANPSKKFHILRATLVIRNKGRGITLYEEVHPQNKLANLKVHKDFLQTLKKLIPEKCKPILLTDAGFYCNWFQTVTQLGWDYIGRVRGSVQYQMTNTTEWIHIKELFKSASTKARHLGEIMLSKKLSWLCNAVLIKTIIKGRKKKTVTGKIERASAGRKNAKRAREPWLLVTSLQQNNYQANQIINFYQKRMQVEENFRDSKSHAYGMGLKDNRSKSATRIEILLLIGMLSHFIAYAIGIAASKLGIQRRFQANTVTAYQVLSFVFLGLQIWKCRKKEFEKLDIKSAFFEMSQPQLMGFYI